MYPFLLVAIRVGSVYASKRWQSVTSRLWFRLRLDFSTFGSSYILTSHYSAESFTNHTIAHFYKPPHGRYRVFLKRFPSEMQENALFYIELKGGNLYVDRFKSYSQATVRSQKTRRRNAGRNGRICKICTLPTRLAETLPFLNKNEYSK